MTAFFSTYSAPSACHAFYINYIILFIHYSQEQDTICTPGLDCKSQGEQEVVKEMEQVLLVGKSS